MTRRATVIGCICSLVCVAMATTTHAAIGDFTTWTAVQDPPHALFTSAATSSSATLNAGNGAVPSGTDIGYQSVNGHTPAVSTFGHAFSPAGSFSVAIDFNLSFAGTPTGGLALGFGIGEDADGANSAGAVLFTQNGAPQLFFAGAARIDDVTQSPQPIFVGAALSGSLFASYNAANGNVTLGASPTPGAASAAGTTTFTGLQNQWDDAPLLASFFLRSDATLGGAWSSGGTAAATFTNYRVLSGQPVAVPEPAGAALLGLGMLALARRTHRPGPRCC